MHWTTENLFPWGCHEIAFLGTFSHKGLHDLRGEGRLLWRLRQGSPMPKSPREAPCKRREGFIIIMIKIWDKGEPPIAYHAKDRSQASTALNSFDLVRNIVWLNTTTVVYRWLCKSLKCIYKRWKRGELRTQAFPLNWLGLYRLCSATCEQLLEFWATFPLSNNLEQLLVSGATFDFYLISTKWATFNLFKHRINIWGYKKIKSNI